MPWLAPVSPDVVWFRGVDAVRFLNDILSQEIGDMEEGEVRRSMLLKPDGKVQHLLWVVYTDESIGLITDEGRGESLAADLGRYKIRVDVLIEPEIDPVWLVVGPWDEGINVSWSTTSRFVVIGERPDLPDGTLVDYERLRIEAGEPLYDRDVSEATIPQETGLVPLMVDFNKGCYLGQELVARIDARGSNVPRPLRMLAISGEAAAGDTITLEGDDVGTLTSVAGGLGLGIVKRAVEVGETVRVGTATATVRDIPPKTQT